MEEAVLKAYIGENTAPTALRGAPQLIRYADDFVVLHAEAVEVMKAQQIIATWLKDIGLELKPSKTRLSHTLKEYQGNRGFDFLGFTIRQFPVGKTHTGTHHGKPLGFKTIITPSKEGVQRHLQALRRIYRKVSRFHKRHSLTNSTRSSMGGHCIIERWYPNSNLRRATTSW